MGEENFGQRAVRKTVSFMKKLLLILIVLAAGVFSFLYWGTYENGVMAGKGYASVKRASYSRPSKEN